MEGCVLQEPGRGRMEPLTFFLLLAGICWVVSFCHFTLLIFVVSCVCTYVCVCERLRESANRAMMLIAIYI